MGVLACVVALAASAAAPASAYVGPGVGITMLGALWAVLAAIAIAIGSILYLPIRLLLRKWRKRSERPAADAPAALEGDGAGGSR